VPHRPYIDALQHPDLCGLTGKWGEEPPVMFKKNIFIPSTIRFCSHKDWTKYHGSKAIYDPLYERVLLMYEGVFLKDNSIHGPVPRSQQYGFSCGQAAV
jgi:hypothetical protein